MIRINNSLLRILLLLIFPLSLLFSCTEEKKTETGKKKSSKKNEVVIHISSDPGSLNPITFQSNTAGNLLAQIFQTLTSIDFKTLENTPVLAVARPQIEEINSGIYNGGLKFTYEIRPEASWDNGTPITAADVEFSLKVIKNPKVEAEALRTSYDFIDSIAIDPANQRKFSLFTKEKYIRSEAAAGAIPVIPAYIYDSAGLMKNFTVNQLSNPKKLAKLQNNQQLIQFAEQFSNEKFQRDKKYIVGSGAYSLADWTTGQQLVFHRKKEWWGDKINPKNTYFEAYPEKLIYKIINDPTAAVTALKSGKLDVMTGIPPKDFTELQKNDRFTERYNLLTPPELTYAFIGMNQKNPILKDKKVRVALAHLIDVDGIIKTVLYGLADPTVSMESPSNKKEYNAEIKPVPFSPEQAKKLLTEAGWKDANGDGILDKTINGRKTPLKLNLLLNAGNATREKIAQIFKEEARKVGVEINIVTQEFNVMIENMMNHKFDMGFGAWVSVPLPYDPKQIWHSESAKGGSNYINYSNPAVDKLIDSIRVEMNNEKRIARYKRFQAMIYNEMPYIYLYAFRGRMAISKRFQNAEPSVLRPGFNEAGFKVKED